MINWCVASRYIHSGLVTCSAGLDHVGRHALTRSINSFILPLSVKLRRSNPTRSFGACPCMSVCLEIKLNNCPQQVCRSESFPCMIWFTAFYVAENLANCAVNTKMCVLVACRAIVLSGTSWTLQQSDSRNSLRLHCYWI